MNRFKPEMDAAAAERFLLDYWNSGVSDVQGIEQGELSRAYFFRYRDNDYVIRFNKSGEGFAKEKLLQELFAPQGIPMPRIVDIGRIQEMSFCISVRAPGKTLISMPLAQIQSILPDLLDRFVRIQRMGLDGSQGYGPLNGNGDGTCRGWAEFLERSFDETQPGFWHGWRQLFEGGMLERDLFEKGYARMMRLAEFVPRERRLVHGDFHLGNIVSDGRHITGILDWEMAMYGDFVFDIATIDVWTPELQFPRMFRDYAEERGIRIEHFEKRLTCAYLWKNLDGLRFYARKNDRNAYAYVKRLIERTLSTTVE